MDERERAIKTERRRNIVHRKVRVALKRDTHIDVEGIEGRESERDI